MRGGVSPLRRARCRGATDWGVLCAAACSSCGEVFWCRHCHNEVKQEREADAKKAHQLDRTAVQEVVCACCRLRQPVAASCRECSVTFGEYFCEPCRFYDNDLSKGQFHCEGCGICRVGFRENYFHCNTCVACLPLSLQGAHKCIQESLRVNCPVCLEVASPRMRACVCVCVCVCVRARARVCLSVCVHVYVSVLVSSRLSLRACRLLAADLACRRSF